MSRPDAVRNNIMRLHQYRSYLTETNSPITTWKSLSEVLVEQERGGRSARQFTLVSKYGTLSICCIVLFFVLLFNHIASQGFAWTIWLFIFIPSLGFSHEWFGWEGPLFFASAIIIGLQNIGESSFKKFSCFLGITLFIVFSGSVIYTTSIKRDKFEYLNDFAFPEYLTTSPMTNVVVHEKFDLPYRSYRSGRKWVIFENDRIERRISNEDLSRLLCVQAAGVTNFLKEANNQN